MNPKTLIAAVDADGCIYNQSYYYILLYIYEKYGEVLKQSAAKKTLPASLNIDEIVRDIHLQLNFKTTAAGIFAGSKSKDNYENILDQIIQHKQINPAGLNKKERESIETAVIKETQDLFKKIGKDGIPLACAALAAANKPLIDKITKDIDKNHFNKFVLVSGSNRQGQEQDQYCMDINGTGLYVDDIKLLIKIFKDKFKDKNIECILDDFSMPKTIYDGQHAIFDKTKFTLLYALMHGMKKTYPGQVCFEFFDDKNDIREALFKIFFTNKDLIPKRCQLSLNAYDGDIHFKNPSFGGKGMLDDDFKLNVRRIVRMCGRNANDFHHTIDPANQLTQKEIEHFKQERQRYRNKHHTMFKNKIVVDNLVNPQYVGGLTP